jgi:hypothetical protein
VRTGFLLSLLSLIVACTDGGPAPQPQAVEATAVEPQPGQPNSSAQPKEVTPEEVTPDPRPQPEEIAPDTQPPKEIVPIVTPPYDGPPRLEVVAREISDHELEDGLCPYKLETRGFPAVSEDGATFLDAYASYDGRDEIKDSLELTWLEATSTRVEQAYAPPEPVPEPAEGEEFREVEPAEACKKSEARTRKRIEQLNAELQARKWRGLETLDALYSKPGLARAMETFGWEAAMEGATYVDEVMEKLAAADRPLEVFYRNGHFYGRVRGIRVVQDTQLPEWRQHENEFCTTDPNIAAIEFDRASRIALVHYNHHADGCLCDDRTYVARTELSPELLAEADQRTTTKFRAAYATYLTVE